MNEIAKRKLRLIKRKRKIKAKIKNSKIRYVVVVNKSNKNFYAQLLDRENGATLLGVGSLGKDFVPEGGRNTIKSCELIGTKFAQLVKEKGIKQLILDRSGYPYHGKIKAFTEAVVKGGIKI